MLGAFQETEPGETLTVARLCSLISYSEGAIKEAVRFLKYEGKIRTVRSPDRSNVYELVR